MCGVVDDVSCCESADHAWVDGGIARERLSGGVVHYEIACWQQMLSREREMVTRGRVGSVVVDATGVGDRASINPARVKSRGRVVARRRQ